MALSFPSAQSFQSFMEEIWDDASSEDYATYRDANATAVLGGAKLLGPDSEGDLKYQFPDGSIIFIGPRGSELLMPNN